MKKPELLLPAGSWEQLQSGILYGGDAFYLTVGNLSLRAAAKGFTWETLAQGIELAHQHNKHIYFCLNLYAYEKHLADISATLEKLNNYAIDGLIVADSGIVRLAKKYLPKTPIHLSTQVNTSNSSAVEFWAEQGVSRVNLARELSANDLLSVRKNCPHVELEVFVHGAMCMALSGRCLLSAYLNQRSGNLGLCTQACRFQYRATPLQLTEETRPEHPIWELEEDENYSKILSADDLCLVKYLKWFVYSGINAIKVEGRTKTGGYVARVADVYKTALSDAVDNENRFALYLSELAQIGSRRLTTGFLLGSPQLVQEDMKPTEPIVGQLIERISDDRWRVQVKSQWRNETDIKLMIPGLGRPLIGADAYNIENKQGSSREVVHSGMEVFLRIEHPGLQPGLFIISSKG